MPKVKINLIILLISVVAQFACVINSFSQWVSVEDGSSGDIQEVKFKSEMTGWYLTADTYSIYKTTNGGLNWKTKDITNIQYNSRIYNLLNFGDTLIAFTNSDSVFQSNDGGENWFIFRYGFNGGIYNIYKINSNLLYGIAYISDPSGTVLVKSTDRGHSWVQIHFFNNHEISYYGKISFINENTGFSIGENTDSAFTQHTINKTTDGGFTWTLRSVNFGQPEKFLYFLDENIGFENGFAGLYRTTNGGVNWYIQDSIGPADIHFFNQNTGIICGGFGNATNFIIKTTDKGVTWTNISYPPVTGYKQFVTINCVNNTCYIGARGGGGMYKSIDAGSIWTDISTYYFGSGFADVKFINNVTGFILGGGGGILLKTTDKGLTWAQAPGFLNIPRVYNRYFQSLKFTDENTGWIVSDTGIVKTTNGGNNWFLLHPNLTPNIRLSNAEFINNYTGWAYGNNGFSTKNIYKSTDGGQNFNLQYQSDNQIFTKIKFYDSLYGYISLSNLFSKDNLIRTTDGGNTWTTIKTGFYSPGDIIEFFSREKAILMGGGGFLKTINGGDTWIQIYPTGFQSFKFKNENTGFAVSEKVYYTTNGGYNWVPQIVGLNDYRLGSIFIDNQGFAIAVGGIGKILRTTNYGGVVGIQNINSIVPLTIQLFQNYPNPFNPATTIRYSIPGLSNVKLTIFDVLGREISVLVDKKQTAGNYNIQWDAANLNSGIYFYRLEIEGNVKYSNTKKMVLLK